MPKRVEHQSKLFLHLTKNEVLVILLLVISGEILYMLHGANVHTMVAYEAVLSRNIIDRNGDMIMRLPNSRGAYTREGEIPHLLKVLVIKKEDAWFYYHLGVNPWSYVRVTTQFVENNQSGGASTITEQLAKILLGNESARTLPNKMREIVMAVTLELAYSKEEILEMYLRTAFLGNLAQGFPEASMRYFGKPLNALDEHELFSLVATLGRPSSRNPWSPDHEKYTTVLAAQLGQSWELPTYISRGESNDGSAAFELHSLHILCETQNCKSTIDQTLTEKLRRAAHQVTRAIGEEGATNAAIVVLTLPDRELLAMVGSADISSMQNGNQINMAIEPRPIGSTIKPLIYEQAFEQGLRPYTLVRDDEYRYDIGTGFPLYPKNYDGKYHGDVTLEHALANSLNVPAVKTLEYVGIDEFTKFLTEKLRFTPLSDISSYQYGIALGGLEMDLSTLVQYLSLFGTEGTLSPISLWMNEDGSTGKSIGTSDKFPQMSGIVSTSQVANPPYVALVNKILLNRPLSVEQFGLNNNLTIPGTPIAVKTGTSRDYHDSWTVGWTPDFIVGVWIGNAKNTPLPGVSGGSGAGKLWAEAMGILLHSPYNKRTPWNNSGIKEFATEDGYISGLEGDNIPKLKGALIDDRLIRSPHNGDTFSGEKQGIIPLRSDSSVNWIVDGKHMGTGKTVSYFFDSAGTHTITATRDKEEETITISIVDRI